MTSPMLYPDYSADLHAARDAMYTASDELTDHATSAQLNAASEGVIRAIAYRLVVQSNAIAEKMGLPHAASIPRNAEAAGVAVDEIPFGSGTFGDAPPVPEAAPIVVESAPIVVEPATAPDPTPAS